MFPFLGKVQITLVWNSRNEKSPSSDKLESLAKVTTTLIILAAILLHFSFLRYQVFITICSFYGEMVVQGAVSITFTLYGQTFRHQLIM